METTFAIIAKMQYQGRMTWQVVFLDAGAEREAQALPRDMQAKLAHIVRLIETMGLERIREPYIKHVEGPLWEMRLTGRDGIARSIYVTASGRRVVVLRTFVKKTQKTPRAEIDIALKRAREIQ
ncbi:MAG: type II toxin-antitoxin system RelE/ParE family toxin [Rhodospirillaceae bacterium]|nr:type II toxin-antitoxin system RelE/ParE family toxin [Rhodospirillaceae bacterium]